MLYTSDWGILGDDRIRRWPSKIGEKRSIKVSFSSWVGVSLGAEHTYVTVEEEPNAWWSEQENCWVHISGDNSGSGYNLRADCFTIEEARSVAEHFVRLIAGDFSKHTVNWEYADGASEPNWGTKKAKKIPNRRESEGSMSYSNLLQKRIGERDDRIADLEAENAKLREALAKENE